MKSCAIQKSQVVGRLARAARLCATYLFSTSIAFAATYDVNVDTTSVAGGTYTLAFDYISGDTATSVVSIASFSMNGTIGTGTAMGDVTGTLPGVLTFGNGSFFNEFQQVAVLGSTLAFKVNIAGPDAATGTPDAFSFFILNPGTGFPIVATSDPSGSDAMFLITNAPSLPLNVYAPGSAALTWNVSAVPEPEVASMILAGLGALALVSARRRRRRHRQSHPEYD